MSGPSGAGLSVAKKKKARIEIIPLIDVIFFLLATFVLFTLSLNKSNGLPVELPAAETSVPRDPAGTVTISVTKEGTVGWDKELISLDQFIIRLGAFRQTYGDNGRVLINADSDASFAHVFGYVVNEVRKAQIGKVYFETRIRPAGT